MMSGGDEEAVAVGRCRGRGCDMNRARSPRRISTSQQLHQCLDGAREGGDWGRPTGQASSAARD
jgi:hypothetical protein